MSDKSSATETSFSRLWLVFAIAAVACVATVPLRLYPLMSNFTPVGALCLFLGAQTRSIWSLTIPMALMLCTDFLLSVVRPEVTFWHSEMPYVYGSLGLMYFVGWFFVRANSPTRIVVGALAGGLPFFFITNFGSWYNVAIAHTVQPGATDNYSPDLFGLMQCYLSALPFHRGTILGDLVFSVALFGAYALAANRLESTQAAHEAAA